MRIDEAIRSRLRETPHDVPAFRPDIERITREANRRRRMRSIGVSAVALTLAAAVAVPLMLLGGLGTGRPATRPTPAVHISVGARIAVPRGAISIAAGPDAVWVVGGGTLTRIDPATNSVVAVVTAPRVDEYSVVAIGEGSVWATGNRGTLYRIDPISNRVSAIISTGGFTGSLAVGGGSVWSARATETGVAIVRVDPDTAALTTKVTASIAGGPGPLVYAGRSLWLASEGHTLLRIDPVTGRASDVDTLSSTYYGGGPVPSSFLLASGAGSVWAVRGFDSGSSAVDRFDENTGQVMARITIDGAQTVAFAGGLVWVHTGHCYCEKPSGALVVIDPATNRAVASPTPIPGHYPIAIAAASDSAWVADFTGSFVTRVDLARLSG